MSNVLPSLIFTLLFYTSITAIGIYIQIKLSRCDNKILGLILPSITFLMSVSIVLGMGAFSAMSTVGPGMSHSTMGNHMQGITYINILFIFLISNIPTTVLLWIYSSERNKIKVNKQLRK